MLQFTGLARSKTQLKARLSAASFVLWSNAVNICVDLDISYAWWEFQSTRQHISLEITSQCCVTLPCRIAHWRRRQILFFTTLFERAPPDMNGERLMWILMIMRQICLLNCSLVEKSVGASSDTCFTTSLQPSLFIQLRRSKIGGWRIIKWLRTPNMVEDKIVCTTKNFMFLFYLFEGRVDLKWSNSHVLWSVDEVWRIITTAPDGTVKSKAFDKLGINFEVFVYRSGTQCQNFSLKRD